eukprot:CAMPEP_0171302570 /NCGR_PEP_ID=MMETSP0816-20121228/11977_1 /TAXON_ID=420281 /ORGANISM="Proboscia inermis, Strain CCAP1064/1" /LENGTH=417 /DNA_ID=CAMNT_0011781145 /DNA_START=231 /DNA_END=1484 /DNA_ORIENTATION=+
MSRIDDLEPQIHDRARASEYIGDGSSTTDADEFRFGVMSRPMMLVKGKTIEDAQWTGVVTGIAVSMLEEGLVDAVVCIASSEDEDEWSRGIPIVARTTREILRGRGVKPALAPSLKVLDEIKGDDSIRRLLFCGVGCAVQAFRAVQDDLGLEDVFVLGTNCADNSPTPRAAKDFIKIGLGLEDGDDDLRVQGYEFMQDFKVHVKLSSPSSSKKSYLKSPYFCLPGSIASASIAPSCLACFDYTNALADVVVGYMAAPLNDSDTMSSSLQSLTVRNQRGQTMVSNAIRHQRLSVHSEQASGSGNHETLSSATVQADNIVMAMTGGPVKEKGMPKLLGNLMSFIMTRAGPKGVNFARYSIDYHVLRNYLHVVDTWGEEKGRRLMPKYAIEIVNHYLGKDGDDSISKLRELILQKKELRP